MMGSAYTIDADEKGHRPWLRLVCDGSNRRFARRSLVLFSNGILQVENDDVGGGLARLGDGACPACRQEQHCWPVEKIRGHADFPSPSRSGFASWDNSAGKYP
jgi:hypothetical protein